MKIRTSELVGTALDWAVATAESRTIEFDPMGFGPKGPNGGFWVWEDHESGYQKIYHRSIGNSYSPSTSWTQGGPIIERNLIDIQSKFNSGSDLVPRGQWYWQAATVNEDDVAFWFDAPTPLIAAMRCYVASKLGDEIEIPDALL